LGIICIHRSSVACGKRNVDHDQKDCDETKKLPLQVSDQESIVSKSKVKDICWSFVFIIIIIIIFTSSNEIIFKALSFIMIFVVAVAVIVVACVASVGRGGRGGMGRDLDCFEILFEVLLTIDGGFERRKVFDDHESKVEEKRDEDDDPCDRGREDGVVVEGDGQQDEENDQHDGREKRDGIKECDLLNGVSIILVVVDIILKASMILKGRRSRRRRRRRRRRGFLSKRL